MKETSIPHTENKGLLRRQEKKTKNAKKIPPCLVAPRDVLVVFLFSGVFLVRNKKFFLMLKHEKVKFLLQDP